MEKPVQPQARVTIITWLIFFIIFVPCDAIKLLLLLLEGIPIFGLIIDSLVSFLLSVIENCLGYLGLWLSGLYRKSSSSSLVLTGVTMLLDFLPTVDDIPFTTPSVLFIIVKAFLTDRVEHKEYKKKLAEYTKYTRALAEEQLQQQRYFIQMQQQQLRAANDNAPVAINDNVKQFAANDNETGAANKTIPYAANDAGSAPYARAA